MATEDYKALYVEGLQALVSAATTSEKSSSGYGEAVTSPELKAMLEEGAKIAREQADTIKDLLQKAGGQPSDKPNKVMEGIVEAGKDSVGSMSDRDARDAAVVGTSQVALHYYIAAYGTLASTANHLGMSAEAQTIASMNDWMKRKDEDYTKFAEAILSRQAKAA